MFGVGEGMSDTGAGLPADAAGAGGRVATGVLDGALDALDEAVDSVQGLRLWQAGEGDLLDGLLRLESVLARLCSARLALVGQVEERGAATATGAPSTAAWLRAVLHCRPGAAAQDVRLARSLPRRWRAVDEQLAAGELTVEQATVIVRVLEHLPEGTAPEKVAEAERFLVEKAAAHDPADLARLGRRLNAVLDPDGQQPDDGELDRTRRFVAVATDGDGWVHLKGRMTPEDGAALTAALSPLSAPRAASARTLR